IDPRASELPFAHQSAKNSGTCNQIASACSSDCNNDFTDRQRGRIAKFGVVTADLLIGSEEGDISARAPSRKLCANGISGARNDMDLGILADGMRGGQNKIGSPQNTA